MTALTTENVYSVMLELFPSQNDYGPREFGEIHQELILFGVSTVDDFRSMMIRHRDLVLDIDCGKKVQRPTYFPNPLHFLIGDEDAIRRYKGSRGKYLENDIDDRIRNRYYFSFGGLIMVTMELEFGAAYMTYLETKWERS